MFPLFAKTSRADNYWWRLTLEPYSLMQRIASLAVGSYLLYKANAFWLNGQLQWHHEHLVLSIGAYLFAALLILSAVKTTLPRRIDIVILLAVIFTLFAEYYITTALAGNSAYPATDASLFAHYAAYLQMNGINPYTWNVSDAYSVFRVSKQLITPTITGSAASTVAYPPLHFLYLIPFKILTNDLRIPYMLAHLALYVVIFFHFPRQLRSIALVPLLISTEYVNYTLGGVTDIVWVVLLALMIATWRRPVWRAVFFGLACSYKQLPWLLVPFLFVRLFLDNRDAHRDSGLMRVGFFFGLTSFIFLMINLPYILANPSMWLSGVLQPAAEPLIYFGTGLSSLTQLHILALPKGFYSFTVLIVLIVLSVIYIFHFNELKHTFWFFPGILLWFSFRSLQSYFIYWIPLLLLVCVEMYRDPIQQGSYFNLPTMASSNLFRRGRIWIKLLSRKLDHFIRWLVEELFQPSQLTRVVVIGTMIVVVGAALIFSQKDPEIELNVVNANFHSSTWIDELDVIVYNNSMGTLYPRFAVQRDNQQPFAWTIEGGPSALAPGEDALYRLSADHMYQKFNLADGAYLIVTDGSGRYRLRSVYTFRPDNSLAVSDQIFNRQYLQTTKAEDSPIGWYISQSDNVDPRVSSRLFAEGRPIVELQFTPHPDNVSWEYVQLSQWIVFPNTKLSAWVYPQYAAHWPLDPLSYAYGLEFDDGFHSIWILFGPFEERIQYVRPNHVIVYQNAPFQEWSKEEIDLIRLYDELGWSLPEIQQVKRGELTLNERMITVRLLHAARNVSGERLAAQYGPLTIQPASDAIQQRIERSINNSWEYYSVLSEEAELSRNYSESLIYYERALSMAPVGVTAFIRGEKHFWNKQYAEAITHYSVAVTEGYRVDEAYRGMGWAWLALGDLINAEYAFRNALDAAPDQADAYNGIGTIWLLKRRCDKAIPNFEQALALMPTHRDAQERLNRCLASR